MDEELGTLSPATLKRNLMRASLFLTSFELLQLELVEKVQTFYATTFDENARGIASDAYREEVLLLAPPDVHPLRFHASCSWWVKDGTLTASNIKEIKAIKKHRNLIAHELPKILIDPVFSVDWQLFPRLRHFITVLGRFWGRVTIDSLAEYDGREVSHATFARRTPFLSGGISSRPSKCPSSMPWVIILNSKTTGSLRRPRFL